MCVMVERKVYLKKLGQLNQLRNAMTNGNKRTNRLVLPLLLLVLTTRKNLISLTLRLIIMTIVGAVLRIAITTTI